MTSLVINGDTSGSITLQAPAAAGSSVHTLPAATGTVMVSGNMPCFSAYVGTNQAVSTNTWTKLQCSVEEFDTANCYDSSTNYRFTPNVAGYYLFNGMTDNVTGSPSRVIHQFYKNGTTAKVGLDIGISTGNFSQAAGGVSTALIYMNGTTDYVEFYVYYGGGASVAGGSSNQSYFQGILLRTA